LVAQGPPKDKTAKQLSGTFDTDYLLLTPSHYLLAIKKNTRV
jgi:hypothetical protein